MAKILYVASTWRHLQDFHLPYLRGLKAQGHQVHAAAGGAFPPESPLLAEERVDVDFQKRMFSLRNFTEALRLSRKIRREEYDLVAVHTSLAAFFTRLGVWLAFLGKKRPRVCNTVHGYLFDSRTPFLKRTLLLWAEKLMAPVTDAVAVMARQDEEIARENHLYKKDGRICFVHGMGVDFSRFPPASPQNRREARQALGCSETDFLLVFAGEFSRRKNQAMLIRAMAGLPEEVKLLLLGSGELRESCRQLAEELGVSSRVRFEGYQSDTLRYYQAADLCVSSSRSEGLPFNLMEAMGVGLPVAATAVKGHEDLVIPEENGILVPYDDARALSEAVRRLLEDPGLRADMGKRNQRIRELYSLERVYPEHMAIYASLLKGE